MTTLRQHAGALLYDWPRFLNALRAGRGGWIRYHNRDEQVTIDSKTGGARCEWQFGTDLHLCNVSDRAARMLFRRAFEEWPIVMREAARANAPRVSFVIGHRGTSRLPQLLATLASIGGQRGVDVECIVVEQSERATALPSWVTHVHTPIASDTQPYNRSWAFNVGARAARSPLLVLHDNDMLVPAEYARSIAALHDAGWEMIDPKRFVFYLDERATDSLLRTQVAPRAVAARPVSQNLFGGSFVADRAAYLEIGGFDETYVGWGGEDNEFFLRASTRRCWTFGYAPLIHLWHAPQPEKASREPAGVQRFYRDASVSISERIARVRGQEQGRVDGPYRDQNASK